MTSITTTNPATGEAIKTYEEMSNDALNEAIERAHQTYLTWRNVPLEERASLMKKVGQILRDDQALYGKIITDEMGKPIAQAMAEVEKCAWLCDHYADTTAEYIKPTEIKTELRKCYLHHEPMGIIFAIMPWNFPFWQVLRFAVPNLMVGNVGLLSHAPISIGAGEAMEDIFRRAGFPEGAFQNLVVSNDQAADIIAHPHVRGVTITGSERAGKAVAAKAGAELKKSVMELGGSDPYLILEDNDDQALEEAAEICTKFRLANCGQVCIAPKRIIVVESVLERFQQLVLEKMQDIQPSDPSHENSVMGPMARSDLRDQIHKQVSKSIDMGTTCLLGGNMIDGPGFYYEPTLLVNPPKGSPAYCEELFGPVMVIFPVKDEQEAIALANDTPYGLGGAVFTQDLEKGERIARDEIITGAVALNTNVASDPRVPFGGTKLSGYGRELGFYGATEFMNIKSMLIK